MFTRAFFAPVQLGALFHVPLFFPFPASGPFAMPRQPGTIPIKGRAFKFLPRGVSKYTPPPPPLKNALWPEMGGGGVVGSIISPCRSGAPKGGCFDQGLVFKYFVLWFLWFPWFSCFPRNTRIFSMSIKVGGFQIVILRILWFSWFRV